MRAFLFKHSANTVTIVGIILAAWANMLMWNYQDLGLVLALTLAVAATDLADGRIARRWKIVTLEGISLDRARDKAFMVPMFFFFCKDLWLEEGIVFAFIKAMLVLILLTEGGLVISWVVGLRRGFDVSAHRAGKIKQTIYFVIVCLWLLVRLVEQKSAFRPGLVSALVLSFLLLLAVIYALKSLIGYLERYAKGPPG